MLAKLHAKLKGQVLDSKNSKKMVSIETQDLYAPSLSKVPTPPPEDSHSRFGGRSKPKKRKGPTEDTVNDQMKEFFGKKKIVKKGKVHKSNMKVVMKENGAKNKSDGGGFGHSFDFNSLATVTHHKR